MLEEISSSAVAAPVSKKREESAVAGERGAEQAITTFDFKHKVFSTPGARFALERHSRRPTFYVAMGDLTGAVDLAALRREFNIAADSHDGKLIDLAMQALRYVPDIQPGDSIPTELVDGTASWSVSANHRLIAQQRLQVQLLSSISEEEIALSEPKEIAAFLEQPENREKVKAAFREAAVALGHAAENTEPVMAQLEVLARELCYIEALRERVGLVRQIQKKLADIAKTYGNDRVAKQEMDRVQQLTTRGIQHLKDILREADGKSGELLTALKSIDRYVEIIRTRRDALYMLLLEWRESISNFETLPNVRTPRTDRAVGALYRFLAPRYVTVQSMFNRNRR